MKIILENSLLISSVSALVLIVVGLFILTKQKKNFEPINARESGSPNPVKLEVQNHNGFDEESVKSKSQEVLEKFDELELIQKIYKLLVLEKIYLQQGLTVTEFAEKLGVQVRIVTRLFGELYGHTFKELTNMYRVEFAKERIEQGYLDHLTMEALGQEAGFSSRTTFFNVFKKELGVCPSEYSKKLS